MAYPATVSLEPPEKIDNWRPLVQWFLAIPHFVILNALNGVSFAVAVVSWFIALFTGRLPTGIATLQTMILRYDTRVTAYAGFLHSEYPPFDFTTVAADPGGQPIRVDYEPQLENRDRLTVGLRFLWAIPALLYLIVVAIVALIMWILAFFAVLFTGRWPDTMLEWVMRALRVEIRLGAYMFLLTDEYPPFSTD